jgi:U3 small nucleolar RNA-associated protein 14
VASYKKPAKKPESENRIKKIQRKRKKDEDDNTNARVNIDVSVQGINEKLTALVERDEDEDAPTMTYGKGKVTFQQAELVNRAFAADGFEEDFAMEKEAAIAEDALKEEDLTLPGWGSWTGQGVKRRKTELKLIKKIPGIDASKRKDAKLKHVIISEKRVKNVYIVFVPCANNRILSIWRRQFHIHFRRKSNTRDH